MKESKLKIGAFFAKVLLLAGFVVLVLVGISVVKETLKKNQIQREITKLQEEAQKISRDNAQIREKIAYLESREYQEKEAKDKLGMQNPDEKVIIIKPGIEKIGQENFLAETNNAKNISLNADVPNYLKWWNYFFKY